MEAVVQDRYGPPDGDAACVPSECIRGGSVRPGWDMSALKSSRFPTPDELSRLAKAHEEAQ